MNRKWVSLIGAFILASLPLSACSTLPTASAAPALVATPVTSGTTAEGRVLPRQSASLSFNVGGQVAELLVQEGDPVKAGDVLARLQNDTLRAAVDEAQAAVEAAQAAQTQYQRQLPKQIAAAAAEVKAAQAQQAGTAAGRNQQAALVEAQAALAQAQYTQHQLETAVDLLYVYKRTGGSRADDVQLQLQGATEATQAAQARLAALQTGSPNDRAAAAQIGAASASQAAAQARLDQLQAEAAGTAVDTYGAALQQAQAALLTARQALSETELTAPFAGTIAQLNLKLGEQITVGAPALVLADLSGWRIETKNLTELKVPSVRVGQAVTVRADALPDLELKGKVESIGAVSQLNGGDVVYTVKVSLIDADPRLRWGMTVVVKFAG